MPIHISKSLKNRLPEKQREGLESFLWTKSGGRCWLCLVELNEAADEIEADHEKPVSEGGADDRDNLNLAHVSCNRAKRATPTVDVRPYLRLMAHIRSLGGYVRYDGCFELYAISPARSAVTLDADDATFAFADGSTRTSPVLYDRATEPRYAFCFVDAPRLALYNDDECQPRALKLQQAWAIYADIKSNPLHEPPACRLSEDREGNLVRLLMFDGQHKTVAAWMQGRERIIVKVYLDLDREGAIRLVNSIQAKIKKLPLSPFELSAKLADEWADKLRRYEEEVGSEEASEKGFLRWLPQEDRARGKSAFHAALADEIISSDQLRFLSFVRRAGGSNDAPITENTFKKKVVERMLHMDPLSESGEESSKLRERERLNIIEALNFFTDVAFEPEEGATELNEIEQQRMKRMTYQSALNYLSLLIKQVYSNVLATSTQERAMLEREPNAEENARIQEAIRRIVAHPVWRADLDGTDRLRQFRTALTRNQDITTLLPRLGLRLGYAVGVDDLDDGWAS